MKSLQIVVLLFAVCWSVSAGEPDRTYFKEELLFYASFDQSTDADCAQGKTQCDETGEPKLVDGRFGRALLLRSGARSCCQYHAEKNLRTDQGTIAFHFRPEWPGDDYQQRYFFFHPGIRNPHGGVNAPDSMGIHTMRYRKPDQEIWLWYDDHGGGNNIVRSPIASWRAGQWHHVAVTWDADWLRIYLDGELTGQRPAGGRITEAGETFFVGSSRNGHAPSDGALDEFYVYARPLSLAEIGLLTGQQRFLVPRIASLESEQTLFFRSERHVPFRCELAGQIDPDEHRLQAALVPKGATEPIASVDCSTGSRKHSLKLPHSVPEGLYRLQILLVDTAGNVLDEESTLLQIICGPFDEDRSQTRARRETILMRNTIHRERTRHLADRRSEALKSSNAFLALLLLAVPALAQDGPGLLREAGVTGGLIVHVGCGDGTLCAALASDPQYVVQGLQRDPLEVDKVRDTVRAKGDYGRVSVRHWPGGRLPYADNLVNLLIVDDRNCRVQPEEITRVLAPRGVALVPEGMVVSSLEPQPSSSGLVKYVKPVPDQIDDWPHYLHGADNNAVSRDSRVGPPQRMQWVCGPAYARSHEINSSMAGMVSAGGRIFYIWDEGPLGQPEKRFPSQWSLIARDGFNGLPLWKLPMPNWGWRQWHAASRWDNPRNRASMLRQLPRTTTRRLVATEDRLYVTLGYEAPVSVLDATTGDVLSVVEGTHGTDEILLDSQTLILAVRETERPKHEAGKDFRLSQNHGRVVAVNAQTGQRLWQSEPDAIAPLTLASHSGRVCYANDSQVVCLDGSNGQKLWVSEAVKGNTATATLVAQEKIVLFACGPVTQAVEKRDYQTIRYHQAHAFSADTGKRLWSSPQYRGPSGNARDVFVIGGLVWFGVDNKGNLPDHWRDTTTQRLGYDLLSGEVKRRVSVPKLTSPGHHYRCYRSKATERFLLLPKRGVEFLDLQGEDHMRHDWLRAPCTYGFMPANGMLYTAPHQCVCYQGVLLSNFTALTAGTKDGERRTDDSSGRTEARLKRGPAYGKIHPSSFKPHPSTDWPMYRHDPRRSGAADTTVPDRPKQRWEIGLRAPITPPVVAQGRLLVAEKDAHTIQALDARTGRRLWHYTAGARIDSPPTVHGPLALFGSSDGWVYCLDVSDGTEVWRFLAAPEERQVGAFGQLESAWSVHGSVVVQNDVTVTPPRPLVYFTAGRSTYLDGGIHVYALDPQTGDMCYQNRLSGPRPDPFEDTGGAGYMDGAKSDILVSDGADLFLHQERFRSDLKRFPSPMQQLDRERGGYREYPPYPERGSNAMRLLSSRGFLDDSYNEGTYWAFSQRWPGWDRHMNRIGAYGQLLVFNERTVFGVKVFTEVIRVRRGFFPGTKGYRVFAKAYEPGRSEEEFRKTKDDWSVHIPVRVRAMVLAGDKLFVAGPPDVIPDDDPLAAFEGRKGAELWAISATTGRTLAELPRLKAPPAYDGLIAADACLYLSTTDGRIHCFGE